MLHNLLDLQFPTGSEIYEISGETVSSIPRTGSGVRTDDPVWVLLGSASPVGPGSMLLAERELIRSSTNSVACLPSGNPKLRWHKHSSAPFAEVSSRVVLNTCRWPHRLDRPDLNSIGLQGPFRSARAPCHRARGPAIRQQTFRRAPIRQLAGLRQADYLVPHHNLLITKVRTRLGQRVTKSCAMAAAFSLCLVERPGIKEDLIAHDQAVFERHQGCRAANPD